MARIITERVTARIDGDIVVFLIGLRFNKLWKVHKWFPVLSAMPRMLRELYSDPSLGFLGANADCGEFDLKLTLFRSPAALRKWLAQHHATAGELWVGFYRKDSGKPSLTWPESVDEALCFGWIDGIRKRVDDLSYAIRFSRRKPRSIWSAVNIRRARALIKAGRMKPAGLEAFGARKENRSGTYSYEQRSAEFGEPYARLFGKNRTAWKYFRARPPSYRKAAIWWVVSAKKEETRLKRLDRLIQDSARGRPIPPLTRTKPSP